VENKRLRGGGCLVIDVESKLVGMQRVSKME
jgi:hypothetical protein